MMETYYTLRLESDAVVTASSATAGGHETLNYVPGAALLGAAAHRLRGLFEEDPELAFTLFHSGRVRFLPALPMGTNGQRSLPAPLSCHHEKDARLGDGLENLAVGRVARLEVAKQIREGYVTPDGQLVTVSPREALKCATERQMALHEAGEEEEGDVNNLYSYQSIPAGTELLFSVQVDDDLPGGRAPLDVSERVAQALDDHVAVGRSRSAEFGWARVDACGEPASWPLASGQDDHVLIYLCSDLALTDPATGQPTLSPQSAHFGLDGEPDLTHTFLRARRYSPFNAHRQRPDLERQVLAAGSVLAFRCQATLDLDEVRTRLKHGVGLWRQDGLGQVLVNPAFLSSEKLSVLEPEDRDPPQAAAPGGELAAWLRQRHDRQQQDEGAFRTAREWEGKLAKFSRRGPGRAQWGAVREVASTAASGEELITRLFTGKPEEGDAEDKMRGLLYVGARSRAWKVRVGGDEAVKIFHELAAGHGEDAALPTVVRLLAARMAKLAEQQERDR